MLNGYKVVVLGSSGITETHLKALKNIKEYELKYIIGKNFNKAKALATKYNIEALNEVNDNILSECNLAVITNSTKSHYKSIVQLSNKIKNFIIEKPLVGNLEEFNKLKEVIEKQKLNILEVSQNKYAPFLKKYKYKTPYLEIFIKKNRNNNDYFDYEGQFDFYKNPISSQMPHWIDISEYLIGSYLDITKVIKKKIGDCRFNNFFEIYFSNTNDKKCKISLDFSHTKNEPTKIYFLRKHYVFDDQKLIKRIKNTLIKKFNLITPITFQEKAFKLMYEDYLKLLNNNETITPTLYQNKIKIITKLYEYL